MGKVKYQCSRDGETLMFEGSEEEFKKWSEDNEVSIPSFSLPTFKPFRSFSDYWSPLFEFPRLTRKRDSIDVLVEEVQKRLEQKKEAD